MAGASAAVAGRQVEAGHRGHPAAQELAFFEAHFEHWQLAVLQHVEQARALVVHVARALLVHAVGADDGAVVLDVAALAVQVFLAGLLAVLRFHKQAFGVAGEAFVHPHVGDVLGGDVVAKPLVPTFMDDDEVKFIAVTKPLVPTFMDDDEVELIAPAGGRAVVAEVAVLVLVAVGHGALVFHAQAAIAHIFEAGGHGHANQHTIHLIGLLVFGGPPDAGAHALAGRSHPRLPGGILGEHHAAIPGRLFGDGREARILDRKLLAAALLDGLREG
nr:hypothetical protein [Tanacetum cinerariifolium]